MILRVAHVEVGVHDLDEAEQFYVGLLGLVRCRRTETSLYLRGTHEFDLWTLKLTKAPVAGLHHFALRVDSPEELQRLEATHRERGFPVARCPAKTEFGAGELLRVLAPDGFPVEFVHEVDEVDVYTPLGVRIPARNAHLHRSSGPVRVDHTNMRVTDMARSMEYWAGLLGFRASEIARDGDGHIASAWLRRRPQTHDIAIARRSAKGFHHFALYVGEPQVILELADIMGDARLPGMIERGPGRHGVSNALYLYVRDPSGNRIELFNGDYVRDLDRPPIEWSAADFKAQGSAWWGPLPPESWAETTPVIVRDWPGMSANA